MTAQSKVPARRSGRIRWAAVLVIATPLAGLSGAIVDIDRGAAAERVSSNRSPSSDVRHVVLMLDRPVLVRFRVSLEGQSLESVRGEFIDRLVTSLDANADGTLTYQEASRSPLLRRQARPSANAFLRSLAERQTVSRDEVARTVERVAGEAIIYRQDDLPSQSDQFFFDLLDADGSGELDAHEMASAALRLRQLDRDRDGCVGYDEVQPPAPVQTNPVAVGGQAASGERRRPTFASLMRDTREPLLPRRMLRSYDRDGNGKLSDQELGWTVDRIAHIDRDGDHQLAERELASLANMPVDLEIAVDVAAAHGQPRLTVAGHDGQLTGTRAQARGNTLSVSGTTLLVTYRHVDPVPAAIENAMRRFNLLDADGNGYLEQSEVAADVRFRRGLFDLIDTDDDEMLFAEEMANYVRLRAQPDATSCRISILDAGSGFFQALDDNNDGRISERELRNVEQRLAALQRDDRPGLTLDEPARRFHLEMARGSFSMFGSSDPVIQSPGLASPAAVGPIWFQRMDRNNDGDLTWNEFLGHREDFYRLDTDRDELIDPLEAEAAQ